MKMTFEETMKNENWMNVVVFVSPQELAGFLNDIIEEFNEDPYFHYQIRGKDGRKMMGISLRFFRTTEEKDNVEVKLIEFLQKKSIPDLDYEIDPKKKKESRFKDWSGFINPEIEIHNPFSISWITTMHQISRFCAGLLMKIDSSSDYSSTKINMIHEFVWMMGAVEAVIPIQSESELVFHPGFKDRVTGELMIVGGKASRLNK
jgi:hypothetical protein